MQLRFVWIGIPDAKTLEIDEIQAHSRNTLVYRISNPGIRLVAKAQLAKPPEVIESEYHVLQELGKKLHTDGVRAFAPVALYPELNVLLTRA